MSPIQKYNEERASLPECTCLSQDSLGCVLQTNTLWTGNKGLFLIKVSKGRATHLQLVTLLSGLPGLPVRGEEGWGILQDVFKLGDYRYSGLPVAITVYTCWFGVIADMVGGGLVTKLCLTLVTLWTAAYQAPLSMGIPRQEYWSEFAITFSRG